MTILGSHEAQVLPQFGRINGCQAWQVLVGKCRRGQGSLKTQYYIQGNSFFKSETKREFTLLLQIDNNPVTQNSQGQTRVDEGGHIWV